MKKLVLASASPRRKEILSALGVSFELDSAHDFQEVHPEQHDPETLVVMNAVGKAREIAPRHANALVIGVDTIGVFEGEILEKPKDRADACRMIEQLSGRSHEVWTALCVIDTETQRELTHIERTRVHFAPLTSEEVEAYVDLGESMDKAAAYAAQGKAALFIRGIEGDFLNVVGLPVHRLNELLKEFDFHLLNAVE